MPEQAGPALAQLARDRGSVLGGPAESDIAYLDLDDRQAAPFGTSAKIAAFVAPERVTVGDARLEKASASAIVRAILGGAVTRDGASAATLAAVAGLAARTPCWTLQWSDSASAAALLRQRFA